LENLAKIRGLRRNQSGDIRGRLTSNEEDLLRAAIVFTGAGLDAALKRLIRDTLPPLLQVNTQAHEKFEAFSADRLGTGGTGTDAYRSVANTFLPTRRPRRKGGSRMPYAR